MCGSGNGLFLSGYDGAICRKGPILSPFAARAKGRNWNALLPEETVRTYLPSCLLYHNGTSLYQNDAVMRDILYGLNGRRTNRARIADKAQIFVCSPQYIGETGFVALPIVKNPDFGRNPQPRFARHGQTRETLPVNCRRAILLREKGATVHDPGNIAAGVGHGRRQDFGAFPPRF
jgi:hypothetical protein